MELQVGPGAARGLGGVDEGHAAQAFMGVGQTLPVWRGGGIDQPLLLDMARQVAAGNWAHIFPEARVVQSGDLGQDPITKRSEDELRRLGLLKWGVGKLI
ncbi:MAG: hypothetical protein ACK56I_08100, partial [bacterium]